MARRKHIRLRRPCRKCDEMFTPTGRDNWVCEDCTQKARELRKNEK